mgnify:CR=1 FL=1
MISAILITTSLVSLILAALVGFQGLRPLSNRLFVGISLCFAVWHLAVLAFLTTPSAETALAATKVFYVAAGLFPPLLLAFALVYPAPRKPVSNLTLGSLAFAGVAMAAAVAFVPHFMVQSISLESGAKLVEISTVSYLIYALYFAILFSTAIVVAFRKHFTGKGDARMQAGLYASGILINSVPGFWANLYLPFTGNYDYIWVGPASSVFFLALVLYGMTRHGMFSIRSTAVRSTAYVFTLVTLVAVYYSVAYLLTFLFPQAEALATFTPLNMSIALVLALIFQPVKRFFDKTTNRVFYRDTYSTDTFYTEFNKTLAATANLSTLFAKAAQYISDTLKSDGVSFFAYADKRRITVGVPRAINLPPADADMLAEYTRMHQGVIALDKLQDASMRRMLVSHRVSLVLPLQYEQEVIGYLLLGAHKGAGYTPRDITTLETVSDELAIAVHNALSVYALKELNSSLEQRIDAATKELRASNNQLQKLDEAKDEFISMASHQLRTPLTSIKGYISMLMEGDVGKVSAEQKELLAQVFMSSERMVRLISDFLNVSRLQTGKFVIERHPVDLSLLVRRELDGLESSAAARNLTFQFKAPKNLPILELDENKIQQVVMNFCDNAIYYSRDGGKITVTLKKVAGAVELRVKDSGIGVPEHERAQLFGKFFRATNARRARPDGTGVGLFLAKKVIQDHGGTILFESTEGKGSTFGFRLPVK